MSKLLYIVFQNVGAGRMWIEEVKEDSNWTYQQLGGNHASNVFESYSKEECENYIAEEIKTSTKFVVFSGRNSDGENCYWIEKMDCCSGTYQEVGGSHSNWLKEYETEEEAQKHLEEDY